jgi:hypothetical protein
MKSESKKHLCPTCANAILNRHYMFNEETCVFGWNNPVWHCNKDGEPRKEVTECENYKKRRSPAICVYC